jgi:hypothetical protein
MDGVMEDGPASVPDDPAALRALIATLLGRVEALELSKLRLEMELLRYKKWVYGPRTDKVDRWRNSEQKQRWLAAALLDAQPRLRAVNGYRHLERLRAALQRNAQAETGAKAA